MSDSKDQITVQTAGASSSLPKDSAVTVVQSNSAVLTENENEPTPADKVDEEKKGFLAFFKTKEFYIILFLGYVLHFRSKKIKFVRFQVLVSNVFAVNSSQLPIPRRVPLPPFSALKVGRSPPSRPSSIMCC